LIIERTNRAAIIECESFSQAVSGLEGQWSFAIAVAGIVIDGTGKMLLKNIVLKGGAYL
jgi:hypothetical protein|tara:strand:- start:2452 stop:2628 length:177 start_codon:yes stop_codon:yes gene_type:complete